LRPDLAPRIEHLRDLDPEHLGLRRSTFLQLLAQLPSRISRAQIQAAFSQMAGAEPEALERLFRSHEAPARGYAVRGVVLFGLAEMARARRCLELLKQDDAAALGKFMSVSHDGDRVSHETAHGRWRRVSASVSDHLLLDWARHPGRAVDLAGLSGAYGCSLPELDRIVDLARRLPGVEGAQMAGAGFGGCIMVLVQQAHTAGVLQALAAQGIHGEVFRPIAGACSLALV